VSIASALAEVRGAIEAATTTAGRAAGSVSLIAVSKTVPAQRVAEAAAAGQLDFGENYAQELRDKAPLLPHARWHYIGPLQRNKVKYVVGTATLIHSVDSLSLGEEIATKAEARGLVQACLIQVNVGDEAQKSGCEEGEVPRLLDSLRAHRALRVDGLMCIPPAVGDPRPHFARLRALASRLQLTQLSMGMSADYAAAIAEGATLVRVGSAIFGARG
jgi:pyridoxal phosphate enzyme (YggS family)